MVETQIIVVTNKKRETFDLLEIPDRQSQLIKAECSKMKKDTNFEDFSTDFSNLVELIYLMEGGTRTHGLHDIQTQVFVIFSTFCYFG
jgi:hypothetical protein